jgi:hypothetical protein
MSAPWFATMKEKNTWMQKQKAVEYKSIQDRKNAIKEILAINFNTQEDTEIRHKIEEVKLKRAQINSEEMVVKANRQQVIPLRTELQHIEEELIHLVREKELSEYHDIPDNLSGIENQLVKEVARGDWGRGKSHKYKWVSPQIASLRGKQYGTFRFLTDGGETRDVSLENFMTTDYNYTELEPHPEWNQANDPLEKASGVGETTFESEQIPMGTKFGWLHEIQAWVYKIGSKYFTIKIKRVSGGGRKSRRATRNKRRYSRKH